MELSSKIKQRLQDFSAISGKSIEEIETAALEHFLWSPQVIWWMEPREVETERRFDIILVDRGQKWINVIKVVREVTNLDLKYAKEFTENLPKLIGDEFTEEEAIRVRDKFLSAGASVLVVEKKR